jgi:hypothetical protein
MHKRSNKIIPLIIITFFICNNCFAFFCLAPPGEITESIIRSAFGNYTRSAPETAPIKPSNPVAASLSGEARATFEHIAALFGITYQEGLTYVARSPVSSVINIYLNKIDMPACRKIVGLIKDKSVLGAFAKNDIMNLFAIFLELQDIDPDLLEAFFGKLGDAAFDRILADNINNIFFVDAKSIKKIGITRIIELYNALAHDTIIGEEALRIAFLKEPATFIGFLKTIYEKGGAPFIRSAMAKYPSMPLQKSLQKIMADSSIAFIDTVIMLDAGLKGKMPPYITDDDLEALMSHDTERIRAVCARVYPQAMRSLTRADILHNIARLPAPDSSTLLSQYLFDVFFIIQHINAGSPLNPERTSFVALLLARAPKIVEQGSVDSWYCSNGDSNFNFNKHFILQHSRWFFIGMMAHEEWHNVLNFFAPHQNAPLSVLTLHEFVCDVAAFTLYRHLRNSPAISDYKEAVGFEVNSRLEGQGKIYEESHIKARAALVRVIKQLESSPQSQPIDWGLFLKMCMQRIQIIAETTNFREFKFEDFYRQIVSDYTVAIQQEQSTPTAAIEDLPVYDPNISDVPAESEPDSTGKTGRAQPVTVLRRWISTLLNRSF